MSIAAAWPSGSRCRDADLVPPGEEEHSCASSSELTCRRRSGGRVRCPDWNDIVLDQELCGFRTMRERCRGSSWCLPGSSTGEMASVREIAGLRRSARTTDLVQRLAPLSSAPCRGLARRVWRTATGDDGGVKADFGDVVCQAEGVLSANSCASGVHRDLAMLVEPLCFT